MKRSLLAVFIVMVALGGVALAQTPAAPAANGPSLQAYADTDKTCLEWTDSCRVCLRTGDAGVCSNIGIACEPKPIACTRREEPPKAEPQKSDPPK